MFDFIRSLLIHFFFNLLFYYYRKFSPIHSPMSSSPNDENDFKNQATSESENTTSFITENYL